MPAACHEPGCVVQVEQLIRDHGKKWKLKEYGYNSRVAEKKGVIVKRVKEFIMSGYSPDMAIAALEKEQAASKMPLSRFIDSIRPGKGKRKPKDAGLPSDGSDLDQPLDMQQCASLSAFARRAALAGCVSVRSACVRLAGNAWTRCCSRSREVVLLQLLLLPSLS